MIDSRAVIDPAAKIAGDVSVGPFAVIGAGVEIGTGSTIGPHVVIEGPTKIGRDNRIFQFASVGSAPQDKKYAGEDTLLVIGDRNVIREYCTISRGTTQDEGITRVGDDNWIMAYVHIAHDCQVGNNTIFANNASLAGHVRVEDFAILGGFTLVHQFCAIGAYAFTGMGSAISMDVPPYMMVSGNPARPHGLNVEGLKRQGFDSKATKTLRQAYRLLYRSNLSLDDALSQLGALAAEDASVERLVHFLRSQTRGIVR